MRADHDHILLSHAGLVERVVARTGLPAHTSDKALEAVLEEIHEALKRGNCVSLKNFGTFYVRPERESWVSSVCGVMMFIVTSMLRWFRD
jgi:hypothetical protein